MSNDLERFCFNILRLFQAEDFQLVNLSFVLSIKMGPSHAIQLKKRVTADDGRFQGVRLEQCLVKDIHHRFVMLWVRMAYPQAF